VRKLQENPGLDEAGWPKELRLGEYAARKPRRAAAL
jgi:hypothetical protein